MAKFMMLQKSYMLILTQFIINHYLFSKWMGESKKKINAHLYWLPQPFLIKCLFFIIKLLSILFLVVQLGTIVFIESLN